MKINTLKTSISGFLLPFALALLTFSVFLIGCRSDKRAKKMSDEISNYVYAYTSGSISKKASIKVSFTSQIVSHDKIGTEVESGIISFSPTIRGKAVWADDRTITVESDKLLPSKTNYIGKVRLDRLFQNVPKEVQTFEFDFRTRELFMEVVTDGLKTDDNSDLSKQTYYGKVFTSDIADNQALEKCFLAAGGNKNFPIRWIHSNDQLKHEFFIDNIIRQDNDFSIKISWNGDPLDIESKGETLATIPSIKDFTVVEFKVIQQKEQSIQVIFSDPLLQNQDLTGKIQIEGYGGLLNYLIDGNSLRVFPSGRLSGKLNVTIAQGIKNINNKLLNEVQKSWTLSFEDQKPALRLAGRGVIIPNSDGLIFSFDAVSLNAVDVEIFKIYGNNLPQFLQTNNLDGNQELERVGKVIFQKKITLKDLNSNAKAHEWTRYGLDLSKIIKTDPNTIYQVRVGFKLNYTDYYCTKNNNKEEQNLTATALPLDENGDIQSILTTDNNSDFYDNYNWNERDNPCAKEYYSGERFIRRNVFASNLGLIAKGGKDKSFFVATADIKNAEPQPGTKLEFYDYQNQLITSTVTGNDGIAKLELPKIPNLIIATKGDQRGFIKLANGNSLQLSHFDVGGEETQKGMKGFIYGERGVWRPGDSLFLNFVLEDKTGKLPPDYPISFEVSDPRGQIQYRITTTYNVNNVYPIHFVTQNEALTGNWTAKVKAGGAAFTKILKIETVKPNRIKLNLNFGKEKLLASDNKLNVNLHAEWLTGAQAANLTAKVEAQIKPVPTTFKNYSDYVFDDPTRSFSSEPRVLFDGSLDGTGNAIVKSTLNTNNMAAGFLRVDFKVRVFEKGGDANVDNVSMDFSPYPSYVGIQLKNAVTEGKSAEVGKEAETLLLLVDELGNPLKNKTLQLNIFKTEWRWWWDESADNGTNYNSSSNLQAVQQATVTTDANGKATWKFTLKEWGRYLVRASDNEGKHSAAKYYYAGSPNGNSNDFYDQESDEITQSGGNGPTKLAIKSDKPSYKSGETVIIQLPEIGEGKVLISLENGTKVLDAYWKDASNGKNTFKFTARSDMAPTIYVHVTLLQPHAQVKNDLPIRLYGVVPISVEEPKTRLTPTLDMPNILKPNEKITLQVAEKDNRAMAYTIDVVDEGLLDLTRHKTPNPWNSFYAREALGVKTWDIYDYVLGAYGGELERLLSIGGDAYNLKAKSDRKANRFKPVVLHLGPFFLEKGKKARHEITIPNYVGSVRTMVVACDKGAYGAAEKTTAVRKALMIMPTLPRVLSPGEELSLPISVFAMENKIKDATVTVQDMNDLVTWKNTSQSVKFAQIGDQNVNFFMKIKETQGVAKFKIIAKGGGEITEENIEVEVRNPNPFLTNILSENIEAGKSWAKIFSPVGMKGSNKATLEVSTLPPLNLTSRLQYLIQYPHGCVEQTTSAVFPQLFLNKLLKIDEQKKKEITQNVTSAIDKLRSFQTDAGGFGYWRGEQQASHWGTNYAGHFLLEARNLGYAIPPNMLERFLKYQQKTAQKWDGTLEDAGWNAENHDLTQAYRLYTLALAKQPELGAMNRLREQKKVGIATKWRLAAAYALSGKLEIAREIITNLSTSVTNYSEMSYSYGSDERDEAMILETQLLLGNKKSAGDILQQLAPKLASDEWFSTQTVAYSLLAIGKFVGDSKLDAKCSFSYQLGTGQFVDVSCSNPIMLIDIPIESNNIRKINVKNTGNGILFSRLILSGQPLVGDQTSASRNLAMEITYKTPTGQKLDPNSLPQNKDFIAEVTVQNNGIRGIDYKEMALTQVFPSGWEIHNSRMSGVQGATNSSTPTYQDIRDDRVCTYFNLPKGAKQTYRVLLNAAYIGKYYLPTTVCEAMYDNSIHAHSPGKWINVVAK